jgi:zinc transport system substrate-binding protein
MRPKTSPFLKNGCGAILFVLMASCANNADSEALTYAASIEPAGMILRELVRGRADVRVLLPPGASPHTYEPKPSDARAAEQAAATFYFADTVDAWAAKLGGTRALAMAPGTGNADEHHHDNPHVWLDPVAVRDLVPQLVEELIKRDPDGAGTYRANAESFTAALDALHAELDARFSGVDGGVIQAHASWDLFLERYGVVVVGTLEHTPGTTVAPKSFARLTDAIDRGEAAAIIAEPQLPREPLETLARGKVPIVELDPLGGGAGMDSYASFIRTNAQRLLEVLR